MCRRICCSEEEVESVLAMLKTMACPHCKGVGTLIRHGFLYGYDDKHQFEKTVRARQIFCSNRKRAAGCGRTFSVWTANKIKRLFLTAGSLWVFLKQAVTTFASSVLLATKRARLSIHVTIWPTSFVAAKTGTISTCCGLSATTSFRPSTFCSNGYDNTKNIAAVPKLNRTDSFYLKSRSFVRSF